MADVSLAGRVVASHYAEPLVRLILSPAQFFEAADDGAAVIGALNPGDELRMLDNSRGWAWGYDPDGRVGYVRSAALKA
ncbi:MAG: SH3 domain-containing protein [Sphingomicrobium sp.]